MARLPNEKGYMASLTANSVTLSSHAPSSNAAYLVPTAQATPGDVSGSVRNLIMMSKHLQEVLRHWSIGKATETHVSDAYVEFGAAFNITITAFKHHNIDLSDIYSAPGEIRIPLEQCLSHDPSSEILEGYMPEIRLALYKLFEGIQARKEAWRAASGGGGRRPLPAYPPSVTP